MTRFLGYLPEPTTATMSVVALIDLGEHFDAKAEGKWTDSSGLDIIPPPPPPEGP